ncbi:MAG: glycosyltransferase family 2 protein [Defluviitaleaceae bacterium]|nr:glycosyltransferase family 2 protein [Defluviitaleaceae bacterium]MCL2274411.1 glycosyltransferase family 2 protein [Defluviitaleaceae bacterium]
MLLSIGMIVKNEEKYLRDCLTGLKPILEQIHSELIIYDTGSTDATVEIAKEFTNKVFTLEWRGDFAWARNHTIDKAFGKWYMYIDADEIIEDATEIINFFNSEDHNKYNCATLDMYSVMTKKQDNIFLAMRLFKKYKGMQFVGKIHEYIPTIPPSFNIKARVVHHGYNLETAEEKEIKRQRNLVPLLELFEKEPNDPRHAHHLIAEYMDVKYLEEQKKYIEHGVKIMGDNVNHPYFHAFHFRLVGYYNDVSEWEEAIKAAENYYAMQKTVSVAAFPIKLLQVQAYREMKKFKEAAEETVKALALFEDIELDKLDNQVATLMAMPKPFKSRDHVIDNIVISYMKANMFDTALEWDAKYTKSKKSILFNLYVGDMIKTKAYDGFVELFKYAAFHHEKDSIIYENVIAAIEQGLINKEIREFVINGILATGCTNDDYYNLMKLRKETTAENLAYFLDAKRPFEQHFVDVVVIAMQEKKDFSQFIENMKIADTPRFISQFIRANDDVDNIVVKYLSEDAPANASLKYLRAISTIAMFIFERIKAKMNGTDDEKVITFFERFVEMRHSYFSQIYQPNVYSDENIDALAEHDKYIYYAGRAMECKKINDMAGVAKNLRMALRANSGARDIITLMGEALQESIAPAQPTGIQDELAQETAKLKSIIKTMIGIGNMEQATQILESYAQVNPTDPEIEVLRGKLK